MRRSSTSAACRSRARSRAGFSSATRALAACSAAFSRFHALVDELAHFFAFAAAALASAATSTAGLFGGGRLRAGAGQQAGAATGWRVAARPSARNPG